MTKQEKINLLIKEIDKIIKESELALKRLAQEPSKPQTNIIPFPEQPRTHT